MALNISADARAAKISKLQSSFQNLAESANALNKASDKFSSTICELDEALNRLSPGVTAWVTMASWTPDDAQWMRHEDRLGFAKINNRWGLSLSRVEVDCNNGEEETKDAWLFNDSPRNLRLRAIDHIPDLITALAGVAERTAKEVTAGAEVAMELLQSVNSATAAKGKQR